MEYVTGDIHGDHMAIDYLAHHLRSGDTLFITGDLGGNEDFFDYISHQSFNIIYVDGNHEPFHLLNEYPISHTNGTKIQYIRPNLIRILRGEILEWQGKTLFAFGGGYSRDKAYRAPGYTWFPEELPSHEEYENARKNLASLNNKVDYILSHTAPIDSIEYMYHTGRISSVYDNHKELSLNFFLRWIEETVDYDKWYFGHFHTDKELWKNQIAVFEGIRELKTGNLVKMRFEISEKGENKNES